MKPLRNGSRNLTPKQRSHVFRRYRVLRSVFPVPRAAWVRVLSRKPLAIQEAKRVTGSANLDDRLS